MGTSVGPCTKVYMAPVTATNVGIYDVVRRYRLTLSYPC